MPEGKRDHSSRLRVEETDWPRHRTRSVFDRYDIATGADLAEAVRKLSQRQSEA